MILGKRVVMVRVASMPFRRGRRTSITITSGLDAGGQFDGFQPVGCLANHLHVGGLFQQLARALAHDLVVFGQQNGDAHGVILAQGKK